MNGLTGDERTRLIGLMNRQITLLSEIETQTELQSRFFGEGDIDRFTASIDRRQEIIEKLEALHQETNVLMQSYMQVPGGDREIETLRDEIAEILRGLIRSDDGLQSAVKAVAAGYAKEIRKLGDNRRSLGGYKYSDYGYSGLFDKKT